MATKNKGTVVQIMGPVMDIRFENGNLPELLNAIEVFNGDDKITVEVAQHVGDDVVRCVAMASTDGLQRGIEAVDTGKPIAVPWPHVQPAWQADRQYARACDGGALADPSRSTQLR